MDNEKRIDRLIETVELSKLIDLFFVNQKQFYSYIAKYSGSINDKDQSKDKPLRFHCVENIIECIFSPDIMWSFYNAILDPDLIKTINQYENIDRHQVMKNILSLAKHYQCPIRCSVKIDGFQTEQFLKDYGFFELPSRNDTFQYIDLYQSRPLLEKFNSSCDVEIYELDDSIQTDCQKRKSEWGSVLAESFAFPNQNFNGSFYSNVWKMVNVGPKTPIRMFIALDKNQVVGGCHVHFAAGIACLFNVTTVKNQRGKGIGKTLSMIAMKCALKSNYRYMVLQASEMGSFVYKKLGFQILPSQKLFIKLGTSRWYFQILDKFLTIIGLSRLQSWIHFCRRNRINLFLWISFLSIIIAALFMR